MSCPEFDNPIGPNCRNCGRGGMQSWNRSPWARLSRSTFASGLAKIRTSGSAVNGIGPLDLYIH